MNTTSPPPGSVAPGFMFGHWPNDLFSVPPQLPGDQWLLFCPTLYSALSLSPGLSGLPAVEQEQDIQEYLPIDCGCAGVPRRAGCSPTQPQMMLGGSSGGGGSGCQDCSVPNSGIPGCSGGLLGSGGATVDIAEIGLEPTYTDPSAPPTCGPALSGDLLYSSGSCSAEVKFQGNLDFNLNPATGECAPYGGSNHTTNIHFNAVIPSASATPATGCLPWCAKVGEKPLEVGEVTTAAVLLLTPAGPGVAVAAGVAAALTVPPAVSQDVQWQADTDAQKVVSCTINNLLTPGCSSGAPLATPTPSFPDPLSSGWDADWAPSEIGTANGSGLAFYYYCPASRICGDLCCVSGDTCIAPDLCCPESRACGSICCPAGDLCEGGACRATTP